MNNNGLFKNKVFTGILFAAACFMAAFVLIEFHEVYILVGVAAVLLLVMTALFLNAVFDRKAVDAWQHIEEQEQIFAGDAKHVDQKYLKEITTLLAKQNELISKQMEAMSEKQIEQTKTLIKYNKENARQLAISERETLEHVMHELKKAIEENPGMAVVGTPIAAEPVEEILAVEEFIIDEIPKAELFEMPEELMDEDVVENETTPEHIPGNGVFFEAPPESAPKEEAPEVILPEEPFILPDEPEEVLSEPEFPADQDMAQILDMLKVSEEAAPTDDFVMDIPENPAEEADFPDLEELLGLVNEEADIPIAEPIVDILPELSNLIPEEPAAKEPAPTIMNDPLVAANPNAVMTPDEIAKLLEAMGN